jgi:hypothetical protein
LHCSHRGDARPRRSASVVVAVAMAGKHRRTPLRVDLELSAQLYRQMMEFPSIKQLRKNRQQAAIRARRLLAFILTKEVGPTVDVGGIDRLIADLEEPIADGPPFLSIRTLSTARLALAPINRPHSAFEYLVSVRLVEVYERHFGCEAGYRKQFIEFVEQFLVDFNIKKRNDENYSRDTIVKAIADKRAGKIRRKTNRSQLGKIN